MLPAMLVQTLPKSLSLQDLVADEHANTRMGQVLSLQRTCLPTSKWSGPTDDQFTCVRVPQTPKNCPPIRQTPLEAVADVDGFALNVIRSVDLVDSFAFGGAFDLMGAQTTIAPTTTTTTQKPFELPSSTGPQKVQCTNGDNTGSVCTHSCEQGYSLMGTASRKCEPSGKWSGTDARCVRTSCGESSPLQTSQVVCTNNNNPSSFCYISCPPGLTMFGSPYKQCGFDFKWYPSTAWGCAKTQCSDVSNIKVENGRVSCNNGNNAKSVCQVKCDVGYALLGNSRFECRYKGLDLQWTGSLDFKCLKAPCEKTLDLRTGRMMGFTSSQFPAFMQRSYFQQVFPQPHMDYATVALYPYRNRQDGMWDPWMQAASCNMKSVLAINKAAPGKKVKIDIWNDNFPSLYHFDVAAHASQSFSFSPDRI